MNILKQISNQFSKFGLQTGLFIISGLTTARAWADMGDPTLGGNDAGEVAQKLNGELASVKSLLWTASQVVGIGMAVGGFLLWRKIADNKSQQSYSKACLLIGLGAGLFFLPYVMGTAASSLLG